MKDFICVYDNILDDEVIDRLKSIIDNNVNYVTNSESFREDKQFTLEPFFPDLAMTINGAIINNCLKYYLDEYPCLTKLINWTSSCTIIQKTSPSEGYHDWHCENLSYNNNTRAVTWMIYLNDVEEGGETEFLYQRKRMKPKRNTALLWPGSWTHQHRGNPPLSGDKYVLTGWFTPSSGMYTMSIDKILPDNQIL
jgi:hypothetical protein|tara:strand:+ start:669 stop:1253 length:585 start_codon:yes stop_codon:yes gene_type:complete